MWKGQTQGSSHIPKHITMCPTQNPYQYKYTPKTHASLWSHCRKHSRHVLHVALSSPCIHSKGTRPSGLSLPLPPTSHLITDWCIGPIIPHQFLAHVMLPCCRVAREFRPCRRYVSEVLAFLNRVVDEILIVMNCPWTNSTSIVRSKCSGR